jgi:hypothetical protein
MIRAPIQVQRSGNSPKSKTRILIISGLDSKVLDAAHRLGTAHRLSMIGALSKPVRVAELRTILEEFIGSGQLRAVPGL